MHAYIHIHMYLRHVQDKIENRNYSNFIRIELKSHRQKNYRIKKIENKIMKYILSSIFFRWPISWYKMWK